MITRLLLAFGIGIITGAVVMVVGSLVFFEMALLAGASNMNGGLAMGVANDIAPLLGLAGLGLGLWLGWRAVRRMGDGAAFALAIAVSSLLTGVSYLIWLWYQDAF